MDIQNIKILLIEDDADDVFLLGKSLQKVNAVHFHLESAATLADGIARLDEGGIDVVLLDLKLPDSTGMDSFRGVRAHSHDIPILILTGLDDETLAVNAVHAGAEDYLVKGRVDGQVISRAIIYAMERMEAKRAVFKAEEKFRGIFENSVAGIFQTSPEGTYLSVNPSLARIYGYDSAEALMTGLTDIGKRLYVDTHRRAEFVTLMQKDGVVKDFESQIYRKDGSIIWIAENARAVRDGRGKIIYYEGMVEDVTARKEAEERMHSSEKRFRSVWQNSSDGMRLTDAQGTILAVNPSYCRITGMESVEMLGRPFTVMYSEVEGLTDMMQTYQKRVAEKKIENQIERHVVFRSGKAVDLELSNSFIELEEGKPLVLSVFRDITIRKQAEERERKANAELARSQAELRKKNDILEDDLKMAREVQLAILPQQYPTFPLGCPPEASVLRFCHRYKPTGEVGGDFFNVLPLGKNKAGLFICDVMGHGVRSALVTTMVRGLVEELRLMANDPGQLLTRINGDLRAILQTTGTPLFMTAFHLVVDLEKKEMTYANAGHPKPFWIHGQNGTVEQLKSADGKSRPALGLFAGSDYLNTTVGIGPGDKVMLYTDGLYGVESPTDEQFSQALLLEVVRKHQKLTCADMFDAVMDAVQVFSGSREFSDDVCLVGMEVAEGWDGDGKMIGQR